MCSVRTKHHPNGGRTCGWVLSKGNLSKRARSPLGGNALQVKDACARSPRTPFMVRVYTRFRLRDAAQSYQQPLDNLRMVTPRAESSPSNCATPGEVSRSPGTMTAHSRFSRNSFDLICHCPKDDDFASPIWTMDQCRTSASAAASSGDGPDRMKWLFPCTRIPTIRSQASRRGSATG